MSQFDKDQKNKEDPVLDSISESSNPNSVSSSIKNAQKTRKHASPKRR
jgi:hypothetical protein